MTRDNGAAMTLDENMELLKDYKNLTAKTHEEKGVDHGKIDGDEEGGFDAYADRGGEFFAGAFGEFP